MARRRYQRGSVKQVGDMWVGRYMADEVGADNHVRRVHKAVRLGSLKELPTEKLALRALDPYLVKVNSADYKPERVITFGEMVEKWKDTQREQYKASTWSDRNSCLKQYLLPEFRDVRLSEMTTERIQKFVNKVPKAPRARNVAMTLRCVWRLAVEYGYAEELRTIRLPKHRAKKARCFTVEQIRKVIDASEEPYKTMYWMAAETGMRAGELLALKYGDVDVKERIVKVARSVWNGKLGTPKTEAGERVFSISSLLAERLKAMAEFHDDIDYLFATRNGTPFQHNNVVNRHLQPLLEKLGIDRAGFHAFRHANASIMASKAVMAPGPVKKARLGHNSLLVTEGVYEHVVGDDDFAVSEQIGNLLTTRQQ